MYRVLARTWRPQSFDELVGQSHVARTLANAIQANRLAHAYVFAGLRGTGKTTVARILAKCLNCETGPTVTPCGRCVACQEIAESRAIDVLEIDAASRTKVEQTRELLELVSYAPVRDRYKILIIDEAHMLSKASFNALLKTLEEPPPRVVFVLATTEIHKVLPTILSRCQVFEFRRVTPGELTGHLRKVVDSEKIRISNESLERIARAGEGSVRDSLSVLERVAAFCGHDVADDDVLRILGAVRTRVLVDLVQALAARDAGRMLSVLDELVDEGHDLIHFWNELIAALRDLLLAEALPQRTELLSRSPEEAAALARAAQGLSREDLTRAFQVVADLEPALKSSSQPRYLFEATLIRLADLGAVRPIEELLRALDPGGDAVSRSDGPVEPRQAGPPVAQTGRPPLAAPCASTTDQEGFRPALLLATHRARPMLGAILEQAADIRLDGGRLAVLFPGGMEALKRQLERPENLSVLRQHAEHLAGRQLEVLVGAGRLGTGTSGPGNAAESSRPDAAATDGGEGPSLLEQARREPGVQKLLDVFGGQVVEIHPLADSPELGQSRETGSRTRRGGTTDARRGPARDATRPLEES